MKRLIAIAVLIVMSGCSFQVSVGYHGRTGIDNETVTPEFRPVKHEKERY